MRLALWLLTSLLSTAAVAATDFDGITCGSDVAKALAGRRMSNEPVAVLEKRYEKIGLKDLGADEPEQGVSFVTWSICGDTYLLLERRSLVVDVVRIEGPRNPAWSDCKRAGELPAESLLVLADPGAADFRAARAWKIDYRAGKFVPVDSAKLTCAKPDR